MKIFRLGVLSGMVAMVMMIVVTSLASAEKSDVVAMITPSQTSWGYNNYSVERYPTIGIDSEFIQLTQTDSMRDRGVLLLSNRSDFSLFVLRESEGQLIKTDFILPVRQLCYGEGCATSLTQTAYPGAKIVDGRVWVRRDSTYDYFYFDPISWTTITAPAPSSLADFSNLPSVAIPTSSVPYLQVTDEFSNLETNKIHVGQIEEGVYLEKAGQLQKIGYTPHSLTGYWRPEAFDTFVPLVFGQRSVAWVGVDGALYVATIDKNTVFSSS
ncbi:MAG: hypothetical protein QX199_08570, partial [Methylococcaceae bacterium]